jgi:hypothetical protein
MGQISYFAQLTSSNINNVSKLNKLIFDLLFLC